MSDTLKAVLSLLVLLLTGCGSQGEGNDAQGVSDEVSEPDIQIVDAAVESEAEVVSEEAFEEVTDDDQVRVCRAAIAALMGQDVDIINGTIERPGIVSTEYTRQSDGTLWQQECRVVEDQVEWRAVSRGSSGRWQNSAADSEVRFELQGNGMIEITEVFPDGSEIDNRVWVPSKK